MFDAELQIVDSVTVDISASATPSATTAFVVGRGGFPDDLYFCVVIEDTSADNSIDPVHFYLRVSVDGGSTWHRVADIQLNGNGSLSKTGPYAVAVGLADLREEVRATDAVQCDVECVLAATGSTDDFTYSAYLIGPNSFPAFNQ